MNLSSSTERELDYSNISSPLILLGQEDRIKGTTTNGVESMETTDIKSNSNHGFCPVVNGKEKSPMCLVNELCRFNSITCRYELIEESGAPHSKTFSVLLRLGDNEEYQASAPSIRKAQHSAASLALSTTKYPLPSPKSERKVAKCNSQLTPTVELNVLAMKRREQVQYHVYEQPVRPNLLSNLMPFNSSVSNQMTSNPGDYQDYRNLYLYQRCHLVRGMLAPWYIATVVVGERQFTGKGKTIQIARHAAAEEALKTIRQLPLPTLATTTIPITTNTPVPVVSPLMEVDDDDDSKSPVSLIYEAAIKRKYLVQFDVISESGPSHMPCFVVKCTVGNYSAEGKGVRKKTAKRRAAAAVLSELEEKEPISENSGQTKPADNDSNNLIPSSPTKEKSTTNRLSKKRSPVNKMKMKKKGQSTKSNDQVNDLATKLQNTTLLPQMDSVNCSASETIDFQSTSVTITEQQLELAASQGDNNDKKGNKTAFTLNPISRLLQLQMAKKEDEPKFKLISEVDVEHRRKEFTIQCSINVPKNSRFITPTINNELTTFGFGPNKRIAKRNAAENMLIVLGYSSSSSSSSLSTTTTTSSTSTTTANITTASSSSSMTSNSLSPILKVSNLTSPTETAQNCHHLNHHDNSDKLNQINSRPLKGDPGKERRVKFMVDSINSRDNIESLSERLENLSEITKQQLVTQSIDSPNRYGGQIAPGLLFVMSLNQPSGAYPIQLMDNQTNLDQLDR